MQILAATHSPQHGWSRKGSLHPEIWGPQWGLVQAGAQSALSGPRLLTASPLSPLCCPVFLSLFLPTSQVAPRWRVGSQWDPKGWSSPPLSHVNSLRFYMLFLTFRSLWSCMTAGSRNHSCLPLDLNSACQPFDQCLLSPGISAYPAVRYVPDSRLRSTDSLPAYEPTH